MWITILAESVRGKQWIRKTIKKIDSRVACVDSAPSCCTEHTTQSLCCKKIYLSQFGLHKPICDRHKMWEEMFRRTQRRYNFCRMKNCCARLHKNKPRKHRVLRGRKRRCKEHQPLFNKYLKEILNLKRRAV